jgi:hypothetical protein
MSDQPTCGKGLAETSALPTTVGELITAVADVLEAHLPSLDLSDPASRQEHEAYYRLVQDHRDAAHRLEALGKQMAGYRDLPMGRHSQAVLGEPEALDAFRRFVDREQALLALLEQRLAEDHEMLEAMGAAG